MSLEAMPFRTLLQVRISFPLLARLLGPKVARVPAPESASPIPFSTCPDDRLFPAAVAGGNAHHVGAGPTPIRIATALVPLLQTHRVLGERAALGM